MRLIVRCGPRRDVEREYAARVLFAALGLEHRMDPSPGATTVQLRLEGDPRGLVVTMPDVLFGVPDEDWLTDRAAPTTPLAWKPVAANLPELPAARPLPVLFGDTDPTTPLVEMVPAGARLSVDVLGTAFYMLTRYEELIEPHRDLVGRFPLEASLAWREGFVERPIVDEYADLLGVVLRRLWPGLPAAARSPAIVLSHDVDEPFSTRGYRAGTSVRRVAADLVKRREPALAARRGRALVLASDDDRPRLDPSFTFGFIMDQAERNGLTSSFYFLTEPGGHKPGRYSVLEPWAQELFRSIAGRGHRLGLHVSYDAFLDSRRTRAEFQRLLSATAAAGVDQPEWGGRQHWLRWANPDTWQDWDDAGLDFDSTVGFEEQPGFRCGTTRPFNVFNLLSRRTLRLEERPLHVMETTFFDRGRDAEAIAAQALSLNATCRRHGGTFVLLWHNSSLDCKRHRGVYAELLRNLA